MASFSFQDQPKKSDIMLFSFTFFLPSWLVLGLIYYLASFIYDFFDL
jgi:hypothetical protein